MNKQTNKNNVLYCCLFCNMFRGGERVGSLFHHIYNEMLLYYIYCRLGSRMSSVVHYAQHEDVFLITAYMFTGQLATGNTSFIHQTAFVTICEFCTVKLCFVGVKYTWMNEKMKKGPSVLFSLLLCSLHPHPLSIFTHLSHSLALHVHVSERGVVYRQSRFLDSCLCYLKCIFFWRDFYTVLVIFVWIFTDCYKFTFLLSYLSWQFHFYHLSAWRVYYCMEKFYQNE